MKMPFRSLWGEFKAFAFQGNMIELAVAVVIGAAFGDVIKALVADVVNPSIVYAVRAAREVKDKTAEAAQTVASKTGLATTGPSTPTTQAVGLQTVPVTPPPPPPPPTPPAVVTAVPAAPATPTPAKPDPTKAVQFEWKVGEFKIGDLIGTFINFMIVAFAVFVVIVKLIGGTVKRVGGTPKPGEPTTKECSECLSIIPIKARRCSHCTAVVEVPPPATPAA